MVDIRTIPDRLLAFENALSEIPQIKRGKVFCHQCGNVEAISSANFRAGWPNCCGYTMSLDSPEERAAMRAKGE